MANPETVPAPKPAAVPADKPAARVDALPPVAPMHAPAVTRGPSPTDEYEVTHMGVGAYQRGQKVTAERLVPMPRDTPVEDRPRLMAEGIARLLELGAVAPVPKD